MCPDDKANKLVTQVYQDAASPAAQEVGKVLAGVVRAALSPASLVVLTVDEAFALAQEHVQERFRKWRIPPARVVPPPSEIADPVVRLLRFPNQDPTLREMYLNLLARSMDSETRALSHPAFADVLRQLSPMEARFLTALPATQSSIPLLEVRRQLPDGSFQTIRKHICDLGDHLPLPCEVPNSSIDNLERVRIIAIHTDQRVFPPTLYDPLREGAVAKRAAGAVEPDVGVVAFHPYLAEITAFGAAFLAAVSESGPTGVQVDGA
jgi:hypothetical protein